MGKIFKLAAGVVVAGVVLYFGIGLARSWQAKFNKKSEEIAKNSGGGEMGHIANLYQVLDATDPNRHEVPSGGGPDASLAEARRVAHLGSGGSISPGNSAPLQTPAWTLDLNAASIPGGRANGMISETRFVVDFAQITKVGQAYVLSLGQGNPGNPERDVMIYLHPNGGLPGRSWTISPQMSGANVPQVIESWKTDPRYAAQQKLFKSGYAMRLEFGSLTADSVPGKIYLALPDGEQSVVAGSFELDSAAPGMN